MSLRLKREVITTAVILFLPVLFVTIMHREITGSMTIFTVRTTPLRIYYSDSGNLGLALRPNKDRTD